MTIPHLGIYNGIIPSNPIFNSLKVVEFKINNKPSTLLNNLLYQIEDDIIHFNANIINGKIQPLSLLLNTLNCEDKVDISIKILDKENTVISVLKFNDFKFTKFVGLYDIDYEKDDLYNIKMNFDFSSISYYPINDRYEKIQKIKEAIYKKGDKSWINVIKKEWL